MIIYATGYNLTFPFFDPEFLSAPDNRIDLYRRIIKPGIDDLLFAGFAQATPDALPVRGVPGAAHRGVRDGRVRPAVGRRDARGDQGRRREVHGPHARPAAAHPPARLLRLRAPDADQELPQGRKRAASAACRPSGRARRDQRAPRGDERRTALLESLDHHLRHVDPGQGSLDSINIADISRRAGVTRSAFYFYFDNKASAVAALMEEMYDESMVAADLLRGEGSPGRARRGHGPRAVRRVGAARAHLPGDVRRQGDEHDRPRALGQRPRVFRAGRRARSWRRSGPPAARRPGRTPPPSPASCSSSTTGCWSASPSAGRCRASSWSRRSSSLGANHLRDQHRTDER